MIRILRPALLLLAGALAASGQSRAPVVFLNGYQLGCGMPPSSAFTFGYLEQFLKSEGVPTYFFDNCSVRSTGSARPSIEELGQAFARFLDAIPSPQVDVIAHSMGGLIARAYIEGALPNGSFAPPAVNRIRRAVFLGTPNTGALALVYFFVASGIDTQLEELLPGSQFEWTINTANQGSFDFRGTEALAIAGNAAGTSKSPHTSDGVVPVISASLARFAGADHVRVINGCHSPGLPINLCDGPPIAWIDSNTHPSFLAIDSFLKGTNDWRGVGRSAAEDPVLSQAGGIDVVVADSSGAISRSVRGIAASQGELPGNSASGVFFGDLLRAGDYRFTISGAPSGAPGSFSFTPSFGYPVPVVVKNGPRIDSVLAASGPLSTLSRAPGMMVALYGASLAGATLSVAGTPVPLLYSADTQLNAILPGGISGVVPCTVNTAAGSHTVNLFIEPVVPALFAAVNTPDSVLLYATGLDHAPAADILLDGAIVATTPLSNLAPGLNTLRFVLPANTPPGAHTVTLSAASHQSAPVTLTTR